MSHSSGTKHIQHLSWRYLILFFFSFFIGLGCNPIQSATARHYYFDPCMFQSAGFIFPALPMLIRVRACTHATPPPHWACTQHAHAPPLADRRLRSWLRPIKNLKGKWTWNWDIRYIATLFRLVRPSSNSCIDRLVPLRPTSSLSRDWPNRSKRRGWERRRGCRVKGAFQWPDLWTNTPLEAHSWLTSVVLHFQIPMSHVTWLLP